MRKVTVLFVFLCLGLWSCGDKGKKPEYKLSDKQLADLIYDLQVSEVAIQGLLQEKKDSLSDLFWLRMTEIYKLSSEELKAEIARMETDPEKLKKIYDEVKAAVDTLQ